MNKKEIEEAVNRYNQRFALHGYSPKSLGWGEKDRARLRYEILLSQWDFNNSSVLDFGCGFADLFGIMHAKGISQFKYTGVDINENLVRKGKELYPEANIYVADILEEGLLEKYDYILTSGVFNHKLEENDEFIKKCFTLFNKNSIKGFAANFLSDKVDFTYDYTYHANPGKIVELAYSFSRRIVLRNDYMPFEFSIFVNKEETTDDKLSAYSEFLSYL